MTAFPSHLMTDVCIISRHLGVGTDAFATPTFGPKVEVRCAHQQGATKVRDSDGNERVSSDSLITKDRIRIDDRVWLPTENGAVPDAADDNDAVSPVSFRNDRSRRSGWRMNQTFF